MLLEMEPSHAHGYKSGSQSARRITEAWALANLYCVRCESPSVSQTPNNTKACDFICPGCDARYELKSSKRWSERSVPDAGYDAMIHSIRSGTASNLLVLQYLPGWSINQLVLIPAFALTENVIERRKPLAASARRAGWVGCNITVGKIPESTKIRIVNKRTPSPKKIVRKQYAKIKAFELELPELRGWTFDVLKVCESLVSPRFSLSDIYAAEDLLQKQYPENSNIRPKIRQQLQVLRDFGLLRFEGKGIYTLLV